MKLSRSSRYLAALITLFSLLFTQVALAAYTCPEWQAASIAVSAHQIHGSMDGCTGMDAEQPNLCKAYCGDNEQRLDPPGTPHVAPFVASALACVLPASGGGELSLGFDGSSVPLQHATAPPIAIRNCCFRI